MISICLILTCRICDNTLRVSILHKDEKKVETRVNGSDILSLKETLDHGMVRKNECGDRLYREKLSR